MRIQRLDMTRYGRFTDYSIDFGKRRHGKSDLHVIFGPNEAGKTTIFNGYLDFLYGIPNLSPYGFKHEYRNMQVGGILEIDGAATELYRIKRRRDALLDSNRQPVGKVLIEKALSGISSREQYLAMFSLNNETIEKGGKAILASEGHLGELLFSGATGLLGLNDVMQKIRDECDRFYRPNSRGTYFLRRINDEINDIKLDIRTNDLTKDQYSILKSEHNTAKQKENKDRKTINDIETERFLKNAIVECFPYLDEFKQIGRELKLLEDYPSIPENWGNKSQKLKNMEVIELTKKLGAEQEISRLQSQIKQLQIDPLPAKHQDEIRYLLDEPKARAQTADGDLPKRRNELIGLDAEIRTLHHNLNLSEDAKLPGESVLTVAESAMRSLQSAQKEHDSCREELDKAANILDRAKKDVLEEDDGTTHDLQVILDDLEPQVLIQRIEQAKNTLDSTRAILSKKCAGLVPWNGGVDDLPQRFISSDQLNLLIKRWNDSGNELKRIDERYTEAKLHYEKKKTEILVLDRDNSVVTDDEAQAVRANRDRSWDKHVKVLSNATALDFHQEMLRYDAIQDARLGMTEKLSRIQEAKLSAAIDETTLNELGRAQQLAEKKHAELLNEFQKLFAGYGLPEDFDPSNLKDWHGRLQSAHDAFRNYRSAKEELEKCHEEEATAVDHLQKVMRLPQDDQTSLQFLAKRARAEHTRYTEIVARNVERQKSIKDADDAHQERLAKMPDAAGALEDAKATWRSASTDLPSPLRSPIFLDFVQNLRNLLSRKTERDRLSMRISAMEKDLEDFRVGIEDLAQKIGIPVAEESALIIASAIGKRLAKAKENELKNSQMNMQLKEQQRILQEAISKLSDIHKAVAEMAESFPKADNIKTAEDLDVVISDAIRAKKFRKEMKRIETKVSSRLRCDSFADAVTLLNEHDLHETKARCTELEIELERAKESFQQSIGNVRSAQDALERAGRGEDGVARLMGKRAALLVDISDRARLYFRLRIGLKAAEQALIRYRDAHRSDMMTEAEKAFRTLTSGRYTNLTTQADGSREILLAFDSEDEIFKSVTGMSRGTESQFYLALRMAGYKEYITKGIEVPFLGDDIMDTFANDRTSAALGLLREMARQGQVLYFTHHEHVVNLAKDVCGDDVQIHEIKLP